MHSARRLARIFWLSVWTDFVYGSYFLRGVMKILARTADGYMLEATEMEMAQLHGFQTTYDKDYRRNLVEIGYDVDISKLTRNAEFLRTLDTSVITKAQNRFEELAKEMETIRDQVTRLNLFDKLKQ
jgi:hypothetical protein